MTEKPGGSAQPPRSHAAPRASLEEEIEQLERRVAALKSKLEAPPRTWWPEPYYAAYHLVVGSVLGLLAAGASLLFNVVGSLMVGQHPLKIVKVYLTFPLGERALSIEDGLALSTGVLLYLGTGVFFGAALHGIGQRWFPEARLPRRLVLATVAGLLLWAVNFYALLSWIQPLVLGGSWIVNEIPPLVGAATHLVFTWTLTLLAFLGRFEPPGAAGAEERGGPGTAG
jgi:hypothetical protein